MSSSLELAALPGLPMVRAGDDLAGLIIAGLGHRELRDGDVLVVAQKIVSKAEGRTVDLATVTASAEAEKLGAEVGKDPRLVEVILSEVHAGGPLAAEPDHRAASAGLHHGERRR